MDTPTPNSKTLPVLTIPEINDWEAIGEQDALAQLVHEVTLLRAENERLQLQLLTLITPRDRENSAVIVKRGRYPRMMVTFDESGSPLTATFLSEATS